MTNHGSIRDAAANLLSPSVRRNHSNVLIDLCGGHAAAAAGRHKAAAASVSKEQLAHARTHARTNAWGHAHKATKFSLISCWKLYDFRSDCDLIHADFQTCPRFKRSEGKTPGKKTKKSEIELETIYQSIKRFRRRHWEQILNEAFVSRTIKDRYFTSSFIYEVLSVKLILQAFDCQGDLYRNLFRRKTVYVELLKKFRCLILCWQIW